MPLDLDPHYTFDSFIVGTANRLAAAAARRVAETPGSAYNPLFIYSASGLGKTHLLMALGQHIRSLHPDLVVMYDTLEHLMDSVLQAIQTGDPDAFRNELRDITVLLLDDVQFLAGRRSAQEELLRAWDGITARGGQLVLASDRPPTEIDGLDQRLLARFSGGLITDLDVPDYETRVAIVHRKAEERGQPLASGVAEILAKASYANVRELQGALTRVLAIQELDAREVAVEEVERLVTALTGPSAAAEFASFIDDIAGAVEKVVARLTPDQILGEAIERYGAEGWATSRLETALRTATSPEQADAQLRTYAEEVQRLGEIAAEIRALDAEAAELTRTEVLRNPDRLRDAEALLQQVSERTAPLPAPPEGVALDALPLPPDTLVLRAARAVAAEPGARYNPFLVHGGKGTGKSALLGAIARELQRRDPAAPLAFITGERFSSELIAAISRNQVDSWRARYRKARILVIDDVDALVGTERAQEELFHLYDAVRRANGQLIFSARVPPRELAGIENRLRSRLESGLVIELSAPEAVAVPSAGPVAPPAEPASSGTPASPRSTSPVQVQVRRSSGPVPQRSGVAADASPLWTSDKVLWRWPYLQDTLLPELE